jgi:hypothetical protein
MLLASASPCKDCYFAWYRTLGINVACLQIAQPDTKSTGRVIAAKISNHLQINETACRKLSFDMLMLGRSEKGATGTSCRSGRTSAVDESKSTEA